jgi:hypothetical protein
MPLVKDHKFTTLQARKLSFSIFEKEETGYTLRPIKETSNIFISDYLILNFLDLPLKHITI